jgi:glycosyltransferase involved in cell wall biosynthesis
VPRVSVIIPVYNMAPTIARAIDSVLAQTFTDYEIICVDDGSTDDTRAVLAKYGDRIRIATQQNRGASAARNLGVRNSSGEYLAFLDGDDLWRKDKLERAVAALNDDSECVLVYSDVATFDHRGVGGPPLANAATAHAPSFGDLLSRMWPLLPSTLVVRRCAFERAGGFCEGLVFGQFEDAYLCLKLRELGPFQYIPEPLVRYAYSDPAKMAERAIRGNAVAHHFGNLVRSDYGRRAQGLLRYLARYKVNLLSHGGLLALQRGDRRAARQYFQMAMGWEPYRVKTYLRWLRTFLPSRMAAALGGRVAGGAVGTPHGA